MDIDRMAKRVASGKVRIKVEEGHSDTHARVTVERAGVKSSALMPLDPDDGDVEELEGDIWILKAAVAAWDGTEEEEFELTDEELEERGDGNWSPPAA
jgi:hypothetical protein